MMGFAEEVKADTENRGTEIFNNVAPPAPKTEEPEAPPVVQEPVKKEETKIRIGTREFSSAEDAIKYAQDLEMTVVQQDAFQRGVEASKPKEEIAAEEAFEKKVEKILFENPEAATRMIIEEAERRTQMKIDATVRKIREDEAREATVKKTWTDFYTENQDLAGTRQQQVVQYVMEKNWDKLGPMQSGDALKEIARMAREFLGSTKEQTLPTKELQSGPVNVPGATNAPSATPAKKEDSPIDFISQVKKHGKRNA